MCQVFPVPNCLSEGRAQRLKEAAISYSPHAYIPKRTLTEEEALSCIALE